MRSVSPYEEYGVAEPDADASLRIHLFIQGETISALAELYYADWRLWRLIAVRNSIADVRKIEPGTELIIPDRPLQKGRYEST
jgi:nucleoid-associated protein YgaU